jgi:hypothetical protein
MVVHIKNKLKIVLKTHHQQAPVAAAPDSKSRCEENSTLYY